MLEITAKPKKKLISHLLSLSLPLPISSPSSSQNSNQLRRWDKFFKAIDWVQGEFNVYRKWPGEFNYESPTEPKSAPKGHLPLTNALRGTQLFQAILEHPAWDEAPQGVEGKSGSKGPEWLK